MTVIGRNENENENQGSASVDDVDLENNVVDTSLSSSSFPHNNNNNNNNNNSGDDHHQEPSELHADVDNDDDDDVTVIVLEREAENALISQSAAAGWETEQTPEMEERRRNVLMRELNRVQRASFMHFMLLCLIPTTLLFVVIVTVLAGDNEECTSEVTHCEREPRAFVNAFTTRCVCEAIIVSTEGD